MPYDSVSQVPDNVKRQESLSEVSNGLVRIAVAYTGDFEYPGKGKFKITAADLDDMRDYLAEREVPIDYEHLSAAPGVPPGWTKAAGWIRKPGEIEDVDGMDSLSSRCKCNTLLV